jgi:hypothetical protein
MSDHLHGPTINIFGDHISRVQNSDRISEARTVLGNRSDGIYSGQSLTGIDLDNLTFQPNDGVRKNACKHNEQIFLTGSYKWKPQKIILYWLGMFQTIFKGAPEKY